MGLFRRLLLPSALAGILSQFALTAVIGLRPPIDLLNENAAEWVISITFWVLLISGGLLTVALPLASYLVRRRIKPPAAFALLAAACMPGGAMIAMLLFFSPIKLAAGLGALVGLITALIWLPLNRDLLRSAR